MTEAETILKIIETVDPADTAKLDEIDARVWCWLEGNMEFVKLDNWGGKNPYLIFKFTDAPRPQVCEELSVPLCFGAAGNRKFPQSRDALKAIRPKPYDHKTGGYQKSWYFQILPNGDGEWRCDYGQQSANPSGKTPYFLSEELAELHAIIQAIGV